MANVRPAPVIVGRDRELRLLDQLLGELRSGRGRTVWVQGEPGIGKSTVVGHLVAAAEDAGCQVYTGAAAELTHSFPLRLLAGCLAVSTHSTDTLRKEVAGLLRGSTTIHAVDPVLAAGERIVELVDRLCADRPVLLVAEDVQWADEASLLFWYQLSRSVNQIPLLLVATCRPVPRGNAVRQLSHAIDDDPDTIRLTLDPLTADHATTLAGNLAGAPPGPRLQARLDQAGGNPLYLRELLDALTGEDMLDRTAGIAELRARAGPAPASLTTAINRRLHFLTEDARAVLRTAAVLGTGFSVATLATAIDQPAHRLIPVLDEATAAGVLTQGRGEMVFRHDLIRHTLVEQIPAQARAALHAELARHLADAGRPVGEVAAHLLAATDTLDKWALDWLADQPEATLVAAPKVAVQLLTRAARRLRPEDPRRNVVGGHLASILFLLGEDEAVEQAARDVLRVANDPDQVARMTSLRVRMGHYTGRHEQALSIARPALDDPALPGRWRSELRADCAIHLVKLGRRDEATAEARQALVEGEWAGDAVAVAHAQLALGWTAESLTEAVAHLREGLATIGDAPGAVELRLRLLVTLAVWTGNLDRSDEHATALQQALTLAEQVGSARPADIRVAGAGYGYHHGRWDEALLHLDGIDRPTRNYQRLTYHGLRALITARRGDPASATRHLAPVRTIALDGVLLRHAQYMIAARAVLAEAAGDAPAALATLARWLGPDVPSDHGRLAWLPTLVRLALAAGDQATAEAAVKAAAADAATVGERGQVLARTVRAQLDDDATALLAAADFHRRVGRIPQQAEALEEAAVRLARAGDVPAARAALADAVRGYQELGASWDIERATSRLRDLGVRLGPRALRRRPTTGWAALTPAERDIARLVAAGKSNPDIAAQLYLSRHTVQTHVANIMRKLAVHSRRDIPDPDRRTSHPPGW